jgi:hypothetical protein
LLPRVIISSNNIDTTCGCFMDRLVLALQQQLSDLTTQNSALQVKLGRDPLCKGLFVYSEDFREDQEIEEALTVQFHGRTLEVRRDS